MSSLCRVQKFLLSNYFIPLFNQTSYPELILREETLYVSCNPLTLFSPFPAILVNKITVESTIRHGTRVLCLHCLSVCNVCMYVCVAVYDRNIDVLQKTADELSEKSKSKVLQWSVCWCVCACVCIYIFNWERQVGLRYFLNVCQRQPSIHLCWLSNSRCCCSYYLLLCMSTPATTTSTTWWVSE